jgi:hypothetical protein
MTSFSGGGKIWCESFRGVKWLLASLLGVHVLESSCDLSRHALRMKLSDAIIRNIWC